MDKERVCDLGLMLKKCAELEGLKLMEHEDGVFFALDPFAQRWAVHPIGKDGYYRSVELSVSDARFLAVGSDLDPSAFLNRLLDQCRKALTTDLMPPVRLPSAVLPGPSPLKGEYAPQTASVPPGGYHPVRSSPPEEEPERRPRYDDEPTVGGSILGGIIESLLDTGSSGSGYDGGGGESGGGGASGEW